MKSGIALAIESVGGTLAMARLMGESAQTVSNWKMRGEAPANKCVAIESISGVSRRDLRSDWADYWPDAKPKQTRGKQKPVQA